MINRAVSGGLLLAAVALTQVLAGPPDIRTPTPVIYLADNLDERDQLGWCVDTLGRNFAERLQAHSCKPRGGDVQFSFMSETGHIRSVAYPEFCMTLDPDGTTTFGLVECDGGAEEQIFVYARADQSFSPMGQDALCVSVGEQSRSAGPFMSRDLLLTSCANTPAELREWIIAE
ncbi:MAG: RICIN domain-containing protein [Pseudomonadota bacterium]